MVKRKRKIIKAHGDEPIIAAEPGSVGYNLQLINYFNWANVEFDNDQLKKYFIQYIKNNEYNSVPAYKFNLVGKIAYLLLHERPVSSDLMRKFNDRIKTLMPDEEPEAPVFIEEKLTADQRNVLEYCSLYCEVDKIIQQSAPKEVGPLLNARRPNLKVAKLLLEHYTENVQDYKNDKMKSMAEKSSEAVFQIKSYVTNLGNKKSAERKPRKAKAKPAGQLVKALKFMKSDPTLGLNSIAPEGIIGAKALFVFNTKTRKFGMFIANDGGLSVKGTTILNYDEGKSLCKTLRKPKEQIQSLTESTLRRTEVIFKDIKAVETGLKGRISEDVLILKVFK